MLISSYNKHGGDEMKILRIPQLKSTDFDLEFEDDEIDMKPAILKADFPDVKYEIIEKTSGN